jgi:hypothetical protein
MVWPGWIGGGRCAAAAFPFVLAGVTESRFGLFKTRYLREDFAGGC